MSLKNSDNTSLMCSDCKEVNYATEKMVHIMIELADIASKVGYEDVKAAGLLMELTFGKKPEQHKPINKQGIDLSLKRHDINPCSEED